MRFLLLSLIVLFFVFCGIADAQCQGGKCQVPKVMKVLKAPVVVGKAAVGKATIGKAAVQAEVPKAVVSKMRSVVRKFSSSTKRVIKRRPRLFFRRRGCCR